MTFWEYLDRMGERRKELRLQRQIDARLLANVIGCALISGFLGALFALFIVPIPTGNEQIVTYMIGQLSGFAGGIVAYHYTLTAGAKELEAKRADNTSKALDTNARAIDALTAGAPSPDGAAADGARRTAAAATDMAEEIADRGGAAAEPDETKPA